MAQKHLYRDEIKKLLIIYSISFIVISIVLVYAFIGVYTSFVVRRDNDHSNELTRSAIDDEIEAYVEAIHRLEDEPSIQRFLDNGEQQSDVYELLYAFISQRDVKSIFYIVDTEGQTILTNNYLESPYNTYELFLSGLFKQLKSNPDEIAYMNHKVQIDVTKRTVYSIGKGIKTNGEIKAYLIFDILESDLNKIVHKADVDILVITDKYNNVILSTNSLVLDDIGKFTLAKNAEDSLMFMDQEYYFHKSELLEGQLAIYTMSEIELIANLMTMSIIYFGVIMAVISIVVIRVADYIARKKTASINQLIEAINHAQKGDLEAYVSIKSNDEFEVIGDQFNQMLVELNGLMNKNSELIDRNRVAEIKQLEAQFNPHFIFNTLESLKYMIHIDPDKATDIVVNFAKILRYSIDYETKHIVLDQDLDYLNSYLLIQKYRYNKRLTYNIDIDREAKSCIVPKLIMQPLIENCISHGYKRKENLHILLEIRIIDEQLCMKIEDNGDGILEERLKTIKRQLEDETIVTNSIGLNNVHRRIKLLYGEQYGLTIESVEGVGTTIQVTMPKEEGSAYV